MKFAVKEVYLRDAVPGLHTRSWFDNVASPYKSCEADEDSRMVKFISPERTLRVPMESVTSIVYKATPAAAKALAADRDGR